VPVSFSRSSGCGFAYRHILKHAAAKFADGRLTAHGEGSLVLRLKASNTSILKRELAARHPIFGVGPSPRAVPYAQRSAGSGFVR
jgi:hypothetical protein